MSKPPFEKKKKKYDKKRVSKCNNVLWGRVRIDRRRETKTGYRKIREERHTRSQKLRIKCIRRRRKNDGKEKKERLRDWEGGPAGH